MSRAGKPPPNPMIRIREIIDPELRRRIVDVLADRRGCSPASIPEWFELDDADFVDLLNDMKQSDDAGDWRDDPRM
jgi:hypothetical protein